MFGEPLDPENPTYAGAYTTQLLKLAERAQSLMDQMEDLMRREGDEDRALDVARAIEFLGDAVDPTLHYRPQAAPARVKPTMPLFDSGNPDLAKEASEMFGGPRYGSEEEMLDAKFGDGGQIGNQRIKLWQEEATRRVAAMADTKNRDEMRTARHRIAHAAQLHGTPVEGCPDCANEHTPNQERHENVSWCKCAECKAEYDGRWYR